MFRFYREISQLPALAILCALLSSGFGWSQQLPPSSASFGFQADHGLADRGRASSGRADDARANRNPADGDIVYWIANRMYPDGSGDETVGEVADGSGGNLSDKVSDVEGHMIAPIVDGAGYQSQGPTAYHRPYSFAPRFCRPTRVYRSCFLGHLWFDAELLGWVARGQTLPALVTTSPVGTPAVDAGVLGLGSTSVLFGDEDVHDKMRLGARMTAGWWWDVNQFNGFEMQYFGVDGEDIDYRVSTPGTPIIARPFVDAATGQQLSSLVGYPNVIDGSISVRADMEFTGAGVHWRQLLACGPNYRIDWLCGYRYLRLFDQVRTRENLTSLDASSGFPAGLDIERFDRFRTENEFHGGELGFRGQWRRHRWSVDMLGKGAIGGTRQGSRISGGTTTFQTVGLETIVTNYPGGLLAQPSNIGSYTETQTAFVGEAGIEATFHLSCQTSLSVGYTLIYWTDVARSGSIIDSSVSTAQIPPGAGGGASPAFTFDETDFWAQGLTASFAYQF